MSKLLYVGPSWANRSYDTPNGEETDYTNLYKELELDVVDLSMSGASNLGLVEKIKQYQNDYEGIIWVYAEPIIDLSRGEKEKIFESEDFWQLRAELNHKILTAIAEINKPVALIGAHSDIVDCDHANITVIHPSWQKFLADYSNTKLEHGWGCEVAHRIILTELAKNFLPSKSLVECVSDTWKAWNVLDLNRVFCWCHPNRLGTELFAREIKSTLNIWLTEINSSTVTV